jgi:hypothetical protein
MRVADKDLGLNKASMDCRKYSQYCANGKSKTKDEFKKMRDEGQICSKCHTLPQDQTNAETSIGPREQETTDVPPSTYDDWYHGGENDSIRTPDYATLTPTISLPGLGLLVNVSFPITLDRFGNVYLGVGVSLGPKGYAIGGAGSLVGGYVFDGPPGEGRTEKYLSGGAINIGGGFIIGGAYNTSLNQNNSDQSAEGGIYLLNPQFSGTLYYNWEVYDNKSGEAIWR